MDDEFVCRLVMERQKEFARMYEAMCVHKGCWQPKEFFLRTEKCSFYSFLTFRKKKVTGHSGCRNTKVLKHRYLSKGIANKPLAKAHCSKPKELYTIVLYLSQNIKTSLNLGVLNF